MAVSQDDVVIAEGKFSQREANGKVFNNLSVSKVMVIGQAATGQKPAVVNAVPTDEIPF